MPKKRCLQEKGARFGTYLLTLIKIDNHIWQSWLQLVYFRRHKLFTWNVYTDYIDQKKKKKCQHSFPLVLTVAQAGLQREAAFLKVVHLTQMSMLLSIHVIDAKVCVILKPLDRICPHMAYNQSLVQKQSFLTFLWLQALQIPLEAEGTCSLHGSLFQPWDSLEFLLSFCGASDGVIDRLLKVHNQEAKETPREIRMKGRD